MTTEATTSAQIEALVTADHLRVSYGVRVLDTGDELIEDISEYTVGGTVEYHRDANVHRSAMLELSTERDWDDERLQPYQTLTSDTYHKTWYLGVFVPSTPDVDYGESPVTYNVECLDKMCLLDRPVGDTYTVGSGAAYITAVENAITASGVTGIGTLIDYTSIAETLSTDMVWILDPNRPETWKSVCDDLLKAIGYVPLWVDEDGYFRSEPDRTNAERPVVWDFDLEDSDTQIVMEPRTLTKDKYDRTNQYRFTRTDMDTAPAEGAGYVTLAVDPGYYALGGTITYDGDYTIHTFTSSGTLEWSGAQVDDVQFLVVAGGGGGGYGGQDNGGGGGGGGGECLTGTTSLSVGDYSVTIGAGGAGADGGNSFDGGATVFGSITATGGGGGGISVDNPGVIAIDGHDGGNGGGGGACLTQQTDGGTGDQYDGGDGFIVAGACGAAGGGGGSAEAGAAGTGTALGDADAGDGGDGISSSISGAAVNYGGGGGGGLVSSAGGAAGTGGAGGGGAGGKGAVGTAGTANRGGGGGGGGRLAGSSDKAGGAGGSGIVIVKYLTPDAARRTVVAIDAVDQTTLEAYAADYISRVTERRQTMTIQTGPWPIGGHNDVVTYTDSDAGLDNQCAVASWVLDLKGGPVDLELEVLSGD